MPELKPMKAPSEQAILEDLTYPVAVSMKLDGVRCLIKEGRIYSSSMRFLPNIQLLPLLKDLLNKTKYVFDGELYGHNLTFQQIMGTCMAHDREIPEGFGFHAFDCMRLKEWKEKKPTTDYMDRLRMLTKIADNAVNTVLIPQFICGDRDQLDTQIHNAMAMDYEGVMIRALDSPYKHGRATFKQGSILKHKFWIDFDGEIVSIYEQEGYKEGITRVKDPTGHRKATHKKADKELKGTFGGFMVIVDGVDGEMRIGGWKGLSDAERDRIWSNPDSYIGRWVRFRAMKAGQKDLPRIPRDVEFRDPK